MSSTTSGYRIAEAARRSGFPAASLRYYERIGLVPPAPRTDAGYRVYRDRDIDRLRFVARAKHLGCTLDEIAGLAAAWDGDECGPVQHRLAALVRGTLDETRTTIAELTRFAADLEAAAASLDRRPTDGPCDAGCGCMTTTAEPVACTLDAGDLRARVSAWQDVLGQAVERTAIPGGVRIVLGPGTPVEEVVGLAGAERDCCRFFTFAVTIDGRGTALEVTAPPDAADLLGAVFGAAA